MGEILEEITEITLDHLSECIGEQIVEVLVAHVMEQFMEWEALERLVADVGANHMFRK